MFKTVIAILTILMPIIMSASEFAGTRAGGYDVHLLNADSTNAMPASTDVLIIPLKKTGRLFMIEAVIDAEQGNLIFDTGASELVLNSTYFRKYQKKGEDNSRGITGKVGATDRITTSTMVVSGLRYTGRTALLSNLSHIENKYGVKVLGLFGFQLIRDFEIVIDINKSELQLYRIDKKGNRISGFNNPMVPDCSQQFEESKNVVFIYGSVGGKTLRFCLDSGAETNAVDINCPEKVINTIAINSTARLSGAGTTKADVLVGTMKELRMGKSVLTDMTTILTNLDALEEGYDQLMDGMLGYDFLKKGPVCINFARKQFDMKILKKEQL